jgi:DMSO/TMAO reductase YedYZ molybdopterin-dependent catalytic subunit
MDTEKRGGRIIARRRFLVRSAALAGTLLVGGCGDEMSSNDRVQRTLGRAEGLNRRLQRFLAGRNALAREYTMADLSPAFRANGSTRPTDPGYFVHALGQFANWRLEVGGLVRRPMRLSLAELRLLPARTQITRHDCVEGWSCIGKWTGASLGALLDLAEPLPNARYVVFHCADRLGGAQYYESIDFFDAYHPQSILAYDMNDLPLPIAHGAPLRVRLERMLGYKMAKYIMRIELVESFGQIGGGQGGYWEDRGYEWYAGI